jgi:hypothetical protein
VPAETVNCHILDGPITVMTDVDGSATNVICPQFVPATCKCRLKTESTGVIGYVVGHLIDRATGSRNLFCEFKNPKDGSPMTHLIRGE